MNKSIIIYLLGLSFLCFSQNPYADHHSVSNEVIYVGDNVIPAETFYSAITEIEPVDNIDAVPTATDMLSDLPVPVTPVSLSTYFPFETNKLSVSNPKKIEIENLFVPIFVMGIDKYSIDWFMSSIEELSKSGAQGVVVQADSYERFVKLQAYARKKGIYLNVSYGDPIAEAYGITTYPTLLVSK